jgi:hypothetical protein
MPGAYLSSRFGSDSNKRLHKEAKGFRLPWARNPHVGEIWAMEVN